MKDFYSGTLHQAVHITTMLVGRQFGWRVKYAKNCIRAVESSEALGDNGLSQERGKKPPDRRTRESANEKNHFFPFPPPLRGWRGSGALGRLLGWESKAALPSLSPTPGYLEVR